MDQTIHRIFGCNYKRKSVSRLDCISGRIHINVIVMIFALFQLDTVRCCYRIITGFRITEVCKRTSDHTIVLMYSGKFNFIKCRKISAVNHATCFHFFYRNCISFRIHTLDAVKLLITYITEQQCNLHIVHLSGNAGITKLHGQCIHIISVLRLEVMFCVALF